MANSSPLFPDALQLWSQTLGWLPNDQQREQFEQLYTQIIAGNRLLNLTRITDATEFWDKHLWDSLRGIAPWLSPQMYSCTPSIGIENDAALRVIDIGTGGGFPGVPIAIVRPEWRVSLLDATRKKLLFLTALSQALGLEQVQTICDRTEQLAHQTHHREQYDLALIRAVGPATVCAEYALPLLALQGIAVLYRGQWAADEDQALHRAVDQLGGSVVAIVPAQTPLSQSTRHYIYLQKQATTPMQYPRATGIPSKRPLGYGK